MDMNKKYSYLLVFVALLLMGCSDHLADDAGTSDSAFDASDIQVGSVQLTTDADGVTATTRATAAVDVDYLKAYLERGLPIRYSQELTPTAFQFANLQLTGDDYTITDWKTETPAKWLYNGKHYFQSTAWPTAIIGATGEGTTFDAADQSGDNYTALSEALAISPSFQVSATVGKITIPYSHRMARVIAYILIDSTMNTTLKNYKVSSSGETTDADDPTNTGIRFKGVKVLNYLDSLSTNLSHGVNVYFPRWTSVKSVIPHYVGEFASYDHAGQTNLDDERFVYYYDSENKTYIFPSDAEAWNKAKASVDNQESQYEVFDLGGKVPVYDILVRPTYTAKDSVMYDELEDMASVAALTNSVEFELELENGLKYTKTVNIDLDMNKETVIYLRIGKEAVDYQATGQLKWEETVGSQAYYGLDNTPEFTLSQAGSSWQRAYTNTSNSVTTVADAHTYDKQYLSYTDWVSYFKQATEGGKHHGDYFILNSDITIDVSKLPADFVFTGHLDAQGHTITLTDSKNTGRTYIFDGINGEYTTVQESDETQVWVANVHKETYTYNGSTTYIWVPTIGWRAEVLNTAISGGRLYKSNAIVTGNVNNCSDASDDVINHTPTTLPTY